MSKLNSKTLTIAGILLVVLALLFMATPLLRSAGVTGRNGTGFARPQGANGNGFFTPGTGLNSQGTNPNQNNGQGFTLPGQGGNGTTTTPFNSRRTGAGSGLLGLGLLNGTLGTIVYGLALLVSLLAAVGMLMTKNWGKILGIIMGVIYLLLALVGLVPSLLLGFLLRTGSALTIGLSALHLVLALAVIILAIIPARKASAAPNEQAVPPAATA